MDFYVIDRSSRFNDHLYAYGEQEDMKTGEPERCPSCGTPLGKREWLSPKKVMISKKTVGDLVFGTFPMFLASENLRTKFKEANLHGIKSFEKVEVVKIGGEKVSSIEIPVLYYCMIERSKARADEALSNFVRSSTVKCDECRSGTLKSYEGVYIEPGTWDGKDIFIPIGLPGTILVSRKFRDLVLYHDFRNVELVPANLYRPSWAK